MKLDRSAEEIKETNEGPQFHNIANEKISLPLLEIMKNSLEHENEIKTVCKLGKTFAIHKAGAENGSSGVFAMPAKRPLQRIQTPFSTDSLLVQSNSKSIEKICRIIHASLVEHLDDYEEEDFTKTFTDYIDSDGNPRQARMKIMASYTKANGYHVSGRLESGKKQYMWYSLESKNDIKRRESFEKINYYPSHLSAMSLCGYSNMKHCHGYFGVKMNGVQVDNISSGRCDLHQDYTSLETIVVALAINTPSQLRIMVQVTMHVDGEGQALKAINIIRKHVFGDILVAEKKNRRVLEV